MISPPGGYTYMGMSLACNICGATVVDEDRHTAWHTSLSNVLILIAEATQ